MNETCAYGGTAPSSPLFCSQQEVSTSTGCWTGGVAGLASSLEPNQATARQIQFILGRELAKILGFQKCRPGRSLGCVYPAALPFVLPFPSALALRSLCLSLVPSVFSLSGVFFISGEPPPPLPPPRRGALGLG